MNEQQRLLALMRAEGLNAKTFAEQVGISAATMSNIVNGRNNPSLEVMQKVLNRFRTLSPQWLILGVGSMYLEKSNSQGDNFQQDSAELAPENLDQNGSFYKRYMRTTQESSKSPVEEPGRVPQDKFSRTTLENRSVVRIVVFYNDGTFDEFHANN